MLRALLIDGRQALRSLGRSPAFTVPALFTASLAVGLIVAVLGVVRIESLWLISLSTPLRVEAVRDPGWGASWSANLVTPAAQGSVALDAILLALCLTVAVAVAIAALTLANLLLSRASRKGPELAIRSALGATPGRLWSGLAAEGACLAGVGVGLGALLGFAAAAALRVSWPHALAAGGGRDLWTVGLGVVLPIAALILIPVISGHAGGRRNGNLTGERVVGSGGGILRDGFVVAQLAASLALLVGAGLLLRDSLGRSGEGSVFAFAVQDTVAVSLDLDAAAFADAHDRARYFEKLLADLRGLPGVRDTVISTPGTLLALGPGGPALVDCGACYRGGVYVPQLPASVRYHAVSPGFFTALGIDVVRGRDFDAGDRSGAEAVAIVSASLAASHFEDGVAVGKEVRLGGSTGPWYRVVGVVPDLTGVGLSAGDAPTLYVPLLQEPPLAVDVLARAAGRDATAVGAAVMSRAEGLGAGVAIGPGLPLTEAIAAQDAPRLWLGVVLAVAGGAALLLAIGGLGSVMRYNVQRRRRELAVRASVGARPWDVVRLVLRRTFVVAVAGVALGVWASLPLVGWLGDWVPGGVRLDATWLLLIALALATVTLLGGALPAWAAARADPGSILRE